MKKIMMFKICEKKEDVYYCPNGIPIINFKKEISINKNSIPQGYYSYQTLLKVKEFMFY